jgi:protease I
MVLAMQKNSYQLGFFFLSLIILSAFIGSSTSNAYVSEPNPKPLQGIEILILVAASFSYNEYIPVREMLELLGCNISMVGPTATVLAENNQYYEMDYLITEIDVNNFDCMFIPGGGSPYNLINTPEAITLVQEAFSQGLIISAICHAPLVLAEADIISGYNISGYIDIYDDIIAAGGNFIYSGVVVHEPFVTANYMYADILHVGIVRALGYYESNPPELLSISTEVEQLTDEVKLTVELEIWDEFGINYLWATFRRTSGTTDSVYGSFDYYADDDIYNTTITRIWNGSYEIDLEIRDNLYNEIEIINAASFNSEFSLTTNETVNRIPIIALFISGLIMVTYRYRKKR